MNAVGTCRSLCVIFGVALGLVFSGCAGPSLDPAWDKPVPPDAALLHGFASSDVELRVSEVDGARHHNWNPITPVTIAPGIHRISIGVSTNGYHPDTGEGLLEDIEVTLQAGRRYVIRKEWWTTEAREEALDVWVEDEHSRIKACEEITVWPHR